jgi:hypothetical protein
LLIVAASGRPFIIDIGNTQDNIGIIALEDLVLQSLKFSDGFLSKVVISKHLALDAVLIDWSLGRHILLGII